jgi:G3E family GTPase
LNPAAQIAVASDGRVPGARLLDGRLPELASLGRGKSDVFAPSARDRASLGVSSVEYHARRPFHPARLRQHLLSGWPGVLRSKGIFWMATRMTEVGAWSQVGPVWEVSRAGFWWSALEEQGWPIPTGIQEEVRATWREPFGDRRQDLVLTGLDIDARELSAGFDACLLTDEELGRGPEAWQRLEDPFGSWSVQR